MDTPALVLTDPKPLPKDGRCPQCGATESTRQTLTPFGRAPFQVCSQCGRECDREDGR